jgi:hypothetical protein
MNQEEFDGLHTGCTAAFVKYAGQAERTSTMLADCTAEPMPFEARVRIAIQETAENAAHSVYLTQKVLLHEAARLGFAFSSLN